MKKIGKAIAKKFKNWKTTTSKETVIQEPSISSSADKDVFRFARRARKLRKRTRYYLKEIFHLPEAIGASRVAKSILKSERMMWNFLDDPENIPLTNNHAERQIRHYVVYRKNSYFTQSERGNTFLERIISLYLTWKQKGLNPFQNLLSIVSHTA